MILYEVKKLCPPGCETDTNLSVTARQPTANAFPPRIHACHDHPAGWPSVSHPTYLFLTAPGSSAVYFAAPAGPLSPFLVPDSVGLLGPVVPFLLPSLFPFFSGSFVR